MKLVTLRNAGGYSTGVIRGDQVVEVAPGTDVGGFIANDQDWKSTASGASGSSMPIANADLAPVVVAPGKIICLGLNYRPHIEETGREVPTSPTLFAKFAGALIGARDPIVLPAVSDNVDWEVELAFIVGAPMRHVTVEEATRSIAGFTVLNDVSVRDYQYRTLQWLQGKTFENSTPVGPSLTTPDEVDDAKDLLVSCEVDGQVMQKARTSDLLFSPADVAAYISEIITLQPGDLVATGTPGGVGMARDPQVWLKPGQTVRTTIEGLGELVNECVKEAI
ncbi:MAG: fumarylacetoacetate hydrolase family protein [Actinomycetota bacterium]|nr:fumarylacetoacetate hydrolase family protein [Actinomycetota bacterium]